MGDFFMFFKFIALLGVAITGIVVAATGFTWKGDANHEWKDKGWFDGTSKDVSSWAVAMYGGLWAYDGWDNVCLVPILSTKPTHTLTLGQLRHWRNAQPKPRPTSRHPHRNAPRHHLLCPS